MDSDPRPSFGGLLKAHRLARGLSQEALAERAGITREAISLLERGIRRSPHRDTVTLLATGLQLAADDRARLVLAASAQRRRTVVATRARPRPPSSLPARLTSFVGRADEIGEIRELLRAKRLVTLTGPGGIGKTSLALAVAAEVQDQFADGLALVALAAVEDGGLVPQATAAAVGVREQPGEPLVAGVCAALGATERLLVLDNCEHVVLRCAELVEALLGACPNLRILATSREPLRIGAEVIWRVPSLSLPEENERSPEELTRSESVCLFVERAQAVRHGFALNAANG